jgi:TonB family protein
VLVIQFDSKLFHLQRCSSIGPVGAVMGYSASPQSLFSLLPKARTPWTEFAFSTGVQTCVIALLLWLRLLHPQFVSAPEHSFRSVRLVSTPAPVKHQPQPPRQFPMAVYVANVDPPANALRLPSHQPKIARIEDTPAPAVSIAPKNPEDFSVKSAPATPRIVATNVFSTGSSAAAATARAPEEIQTGGFGDPNGVSTKPNSGKAVNVAALGSFDLPSGAGSGNGTGGATGARGVVASTGFGNGAALTEDRPHAVGTQTVQSSGFGDAGVPAQPVARSHPEVSSTPVLPAEIISKPTPSYTTEARNLRIQGEVLLEVVLEASGGLHIVRVVRGLGHGLDDNAVKAAQQIRFKPAMRNGQPADSTVVLHIVFQLA